MYLHSKSLWGLISDLAIPGGYIFLISFSCQLVLPRLAASASGPRRLRARDGTSTRVTRHHPGSLAVHPGSLTVHPGSLAVHPGSLAVHLAVHPGSLVVLLAELGEQSRKKSQKIDITGSKPKLPVFKIVAPSTMIHSSIYWWLLSNLKLNIYSLNQYTDRMTKSLFSNRTQST